MKKRVVFAILMLISLMAGGFFLATSARAQEPVEVDVNLKEFKVEMSRTTVPVNTPVKFVFKNIGTIEHEIVLEKAGADDIALEFNGEAAEVEHIMPGDTKSAVWTIPAAGQYQLACHTPGHYQGGMFEIFTVAAGSSSLLSQPLLWVIVGAALLLLIVIVILLRRRGMVSGPASAS